MEVVTFQSTEFDSFSYISFISDFIISFQASNIQHSLVSNIRSVYTFIVKQKSSVAGTELLGMVTLMSG